MLKCALFAITLRQLGRGVRLIARRQPLKLTLFPFPRKTDTSLCRFFFDLSCMKDVGNTFKDFNGWDLARFQWGKLGELVISVDAKKPAIEAGYIYRSVTFL